MDVFKSKTITYVVKDVASSVTRLFKFPFPSDNNTKKVSKNPVAEDWKKVGNDLRISILDYDRKQFRKPQ